MDPTKKPVGKPGAGNPHAGFDERGWETGPRALCSEHPRPSSTLLWPWYRTYRINRHALSLQGFDARSRTTEGDTRWVKKKTVRFTSHSTAC